MIRKNSRGFTLIELVVIVAVVGILSMVSLNFDFNKKLATEDRDAFSDQVQNLISSSRMEALLGKGVAVSGNIVIPDEVRVRVGTGLLAVAYYSGGTQIGTGQTIAYPFRNRTDFALGSVRIVKQDNTVQTLSAPTFDIVYRGNDLSFTGADVAYANAVRTELQVGYRGDFNTVSLDKRSNLVDAPASCVSGCCSARSNYVDEGYTWQVPVLISGQTSDTLVGTRQIRNGRETVGRTYTCLSNLSLTGGTIGSSTVSCDPGYTWSPASGTCAATSCPAETDLIVDGYRWSVPEQQLGTTSSNVTGTKTVTNGSRTAVRTFTCTPQGERVGNAMVEGVVSCDTGYTWNGVANQCDADDCPAGVVSQSGYTWHVDRQISGNVTPVITSDPINVTNGIRTANRNFSCIAGVRIGGAIAYNPGSCNTGYVWSTSQGQCRSNVCDANTAYASNGYIWNVPYQDPQNTSAMLVGNKTIPNGTRSAQARFVCDLIGNRSIDSFTESAGSCNSGYVWNGATSTCVSASCQANEAYSTNDYVFSLPTTASGTTTSVLTGTKSILNGARIGTAAFSCVAGTVVPGSVTQGAAICNAGYTWNASNSSCDGSNCSANAGLSADGYVWNAPATNANATTPVLTGTKSILNGSLVATRTFTCTAGTFVGNALNPSAVGVCNAGYTWSNVSSSCEGIACDANPAYTASGFSFSVPSQRSGITSGSIAGSKTIAHGTARATATFSCANGGRSVATFAVTSGICDAGYYWDPVAIACMDVLPPINLAATLITGTSFTMNWTVATGAVSYEISTNSGVTWVAVGGGTSYNVTALSALTTYGTVVRSKSAGGTYSTPSNIVLVSTVLVAPTNNAVTNITTSGFTMNWTGVSGAASYEISTDNGATWTNVGNNTSYAVTGKTAGVTYQTVVRAKSSGGAYSTTSNVVSATPITCVAWSQTFSSPGDTTFSVPASGCKTVRVEAWGAGGGGSNGQAGGGGAYIAGTYANAPSGISLNIRVGGGGGGGGDHHGGGGGGLSYVMYNGNYLVIAGGGGGSGGNCNPGNGGGNGGGGGGLGGQNGWSGAGTSAGGGWSAGGGGMDGGQGANTCGGSGGGFGGGYGGGAPGGSACGWESGGGGGGAGYAGGGGGAGGGYGSAGGVCGSGGGGGSSYINGSYLSSQDVRGANASSPGEGSAGKAWASTTGGNGMVRISWSL